MARILIVEDNELNRDLVVRRLIKRGYCVLEAVDGEQGLELAVSDVPDVIVLDLGLPGMDGWEVARRLKSNCATREIPIMGLTAHARSEDLARAREAGCDAIETKPVVLERFLGQVRELLRLRAVEVPEAGREATR